MTENEIARIVVDCSYHLHLRFGPGLFESVYEELLCHEFSKKGLLYQRQMAVPLIYDGITLNLAFRADIVIDNKVIVEIKSVEEIAFMHQKQLLTYLKLTGI